LPLISHETKFNHAPAKTTIVGIIDLTVSAIGQVLIWQFLIIKLPL